jgi:uncharacterized protein
MTLRMIAPILLTLSIAGAGVVGSMYFFQSRFIYYPQLGKEIVATPADMGLAYEEVDLRTEDGETLSAWWVPAPEARGAFLLLHGNAGNISHRLGYAAIFRRLGYSTLLVDYRGYGDSTGEPSEEGTYLDATASWAWLTQTRRIAPGDIVVFGESLGGGVATWLASRHTPRALVLASTFTSIPDLAEELYPYLPVRLLARVRYDNLARLGDINAPLLIMHSPDDEIVAYRHARRLFEAAREPKRFFELAGGHNESFAVKQEEWVKALADFLVELTPRKTT